MRDPRVMKHLDVLYGSVMADTEDAIALARFEQACETAAMFMGTSRDRLWVETQNRWDAKHVAN